jgi:hypothetical protein
MAAIVPCRTGNFRVACSETGSPSSVKLKMIREDPEGVPFLTKQNFLPDPPVVVNPACLFLSF